MIARRSFIQSLPITAALALAGCSTFSGRRESSFDRAILSLLNDIAGSESQPIRDTANTLADAIIARNRCFLFTRHTFLRTFMEARAALFPRLFFPLISHEMAFTAREGDIVVTTHSDEIVESARQAGASVISILSATEPDSRAGQPSSPAAVKSGTSPQKQQSIDARLPADNGVLIRDGYDRGILPAYGPVLYTLIMALTAETYRRSGGIGLTGQATPSDAMQIFGTVRERTGSIGSLHDALKETGTRLAEQVAKKNKVVVCDSDGIITEEIAARRAVPAFLTPIGKKDLLSGAIKKQDTVIFASLSSNAPGDISLIRTLRTIAGQTIVICPHDETGGYRLFKEADRAFDNFCPEREGLIAFDNGARSFFRAGSILNSILLWTVAGYTVDTLIVEGNAPSLATDSL